MDVAARSRLHLLVDCTRLLSGGFENVSRLFSSAWNNQLRTGADKGNPTV